MRDSARTPTTGKTTDRRNRQDRLTAESLASPRPVLERPIRQVLERGCGLIRSRPDSAGGERQLRRTPAAPCWPKRKAAHRPATTGHREDHTSPAASAWRSSRASGREQLRRMSGLGPDIAQPRTPTGQTSSTTTGKSHHVDRRNRQDRLVGRFPPTAESESGVAQTTGSRATVRSGD